MDIHVLLKQAVILGASDLHLAAGYPPMVRLDGTLKRIDSPPLELKIVHDMIQTIMTDKQRIVYERQHELDFAYDIPKIGRFRTNIFHQLNGESAAFRVIPNKIMTLEDMKAPQGVYKLVAERAGLVLVTGPTGSGKSTTLAAILNFINRNRKEHILTIEDPIEYVHQGINCLINQREIGQHSESFAVALRSALREDPDVILVGEMRDLETIALAVTAAETGHLVLGTLHTPNAPETIDRVIDVFPPDQQNQIRSVFANAIKGVVAQRLVRSSGKKGRVASMEIMLATPAIRNLVRESKTHQMSTAIQTSSDVGMQTFDQGLMSLLNDGRIELDTAKQHALEKKPFDHWQGTTRNILQHMNE